MTREDKDLLLKDLCGRYWVRYKGDCGWGINPYQHNSSLNDILCSEKPLVYLRSMSSMTEEEYNSIDWDGCRHTIYYDKDGFHFGTIGSFTIPVLDYLNVRNFDYRGLIEKGIALEATEDMYKTE